MPVECRVAPCGMAHGHAVFTIGELAHGGTSTAAVRFMGGPP